MNNNSGFGDINNCSSLDSSVVSSPTVNNIRRNSFYKLTNVLLLLFLVFGSCVVSFGMENVNENLKKNEIKDLKKNENKDLKKIENKDNDEINLIGVTLKNRANTLKDLKNSYIAQLSPGIALLLSFAPGLITGIGGYDNTWRPLNENRGLYWYRHNIYSISIIDNLLEKFLSFCDKIPIFGKFNRIGWSFVRGGVNYHIPFKFPFTNFDMDLHIFGLNFLANFEDGLLAFIDIFNGFISYHIFQVLDLEIKVAKYYSISINMIFPLVFMWLSVIIEG